jgi:DEAD/DEAH box helicase
MMPDLLDPALLDGLSESEKEQALSVAAAARRAEERAAQKDRKRIDQKNNGSSSLLLERLRQEESMMHQTRRAADSVESLPQQHAVFVSKRQRLQKDQDINVVPANEVKPQINRSAAFESQPQRDTPIPASIRSDAPLSKRSRNEKKSASSSGPGSKKMTFKFRWDDTDDTFQDNDPLYTSNALMNSKPSSSASGYSDRRVVNDFGLLDRRVGDRAHSSHRHNDSLDPMTKPHHQMTPRDWRIVRENFAISVRGGQTPPPLRSFDEAGSIHPALLQAIQQVLQFRHPSPIQRQAIPIGLQRRDLIGIAETGSGKTVAFGVPLCHYLLQLPASVLENVAVSGPLALVMAPTRELALQIQLELEKLLSCCQHRVRSCPIVGGQAIQQQAQDLRAGTHIVVGTPGRINECIEMAYLVLNQCSYIVLDEADRM